MRWINPLPMEAFHKVAFLSKFTKLWDSVSLVAGAFGQVVVNKLSFIWKSLKKTRSKDTEALL